MDESRNYKDYSLDEIMNTSLIVLSMIQVAGRDIKSQVEQRQKLFRENAYAKNPKIIELAELREGMKLIIESTYKRTLIRIDRQQQLFDAAIEEMISCGYSIKNMEDEDRISFLIEHVYVPYPVKEPDINRDDLLVEQFEMNASYTLYKICHVLLEGRTNLMTPMGFTQYLSWLNKLEVLSKRKVNYFRILANLALEVILHPSLVNTQVKL